MRRTCLDDIVDVFFLLYRRLLCRVRWQLVGGLTVLCAGKATARNHEPMSLKATPLQTCGLCAVGVANTCTANRPATKTQTRYVSLAEVHEASCTLLAQHNACIMLCLCFLSNLAGNAHVSKRHIKSVTRVKCGSACVAGGKAVAAPMHSSCSGGCCYSKQQPRHA